MLPLLKRMMRRIWMVSEQVNVRFSPREINELDAIVESGKAKSRADLVRYIVRKWIDRNNKEVHA
jgi:Arc/MetJ-type ribon-helix-helix transcriptional regulator